MIINAAGVSGAALGSWSWRTDRAVCSRSSASAWPSTVGHVLQSVVDLSLTPAVSLSSDHLKGAPELEEERLILEEMLEVVEQRDALVTLLEEQRLQQSQEEHDLEALMLSKGLGLDWD